MKEFEIKLNQEDLSVIGRLLEDSPYRISAPIIDKINKQIAESIKNKSISVNGGIPGEKD